jgi:hypothetical protein
MGEKTEDGANRPSRDDLLTETKRVVSYYNSRLTETEFEFATEYNHQDFLDEFGDFESILDAGGFSVGVPNEEIIEDVQRVAREVSETDEPRAPTSTEYDEHGRYSYSLCRVRFGSWPDTLEAAGFSATDSHLVLPSEDELLGELQRLENEFGKRPTVTMVREHGKYPFSSYQTVFDAFSVALSELGYEFVQPSFTEEELLEDAVRVAREVDGALITTDLEGRGKAGVATYLRRLGDISEIREKVAKELIGNDISQEDVLEEIAEVVEVHGIGVSESEFQDASGLSLDVVYLFFNDWCDAKVEAARNVLGGEWLVLSEINRVMDEMGEFDVSTSEFADRACVSMTPVYKYFDSWAEAKGQAHLF